VACFSSGKIQGLQDCRKLFSPLAEAPLALHVTGISWVNDDDLDQAALLASGLRIFLDGPLTPPPVDASAEILNTILSVTMEAPILLPAISQAGPSPFAVQMITLSGEIGFPAPNNVIEWKPKAGGAELTSISTYLATQPVTPPAQPGTRVRVRVHLRGGALWQLADDRRFYIDGRARGVERFRQDGTTPRVDLLLPSGETRRFSDFESCFYLRLQPPQANLVGITISPPLVNAGASAQGTVYLDFPAPAGGLTVTLRSSVGIPVVPANVAIPATQTQNPTPFSVTTPANAANTIDERIIAMLRTTTLNAPLTVQVVSVSISPVEIAVFTERSQQFSASAVGAADTRVTWSVQEANGGSVTAAGLYFAPETAGDFHIVVASAANPAKTAVGTIHVRVKHKEGKEGKDHVKENVKEMAAEKVTDPPKRIITEAKVNEVIAFGFAVSGETPAAEAGFEAGDEAGAGRAFIRPSERPDLTPRTAP